MIKEAYVSFEVAKLLKEKGFDEACLYVYRHDGSEDIWDADKEDVACQKPTHQMAMSWLREVHNRHCDIGYDIDLKWFFQIIGLEEIVEYDYLETKYYHSKNETGYNTYEEAVEAALKYVLENLI